MGKNFLLTTTVTFLCILVFEVIFRLLPLGYNSSKDIYWGHWQHDFKRLRKSYNKSASYHAKIGFVKKSLLSKQKDWDSREGYRIMFLGDSVTAWTGYVSAFEKILRSKLPDVSFDILNAGTSGWDTKQEYLFLAGIGFKYRPKMVILQMHLNDFLVTPVVIRQNDGSWLAFNAGSYASYFNQSWLSHSRLIQFFFIRFLQSDIPKGSSYEPDKVRKYLQKIHELSLAYNFQLNIVIFPNFRKPSENDKKYGGEIKKIISDLDLKEQTTNLANLMTEYSLEDLARSQLILRTQAKQVLKLLLKKSGIRSNLASE